MLPHMLEAIGTNQIIFISSDHMLCWHVFSELFPGFLVYRLQKRLLPEMTALHTNLMLSAAYGLSTNRLTPSPLFNLCSNTDSTPSLIFQRKHLDLTLSMCTQLLWTTYLRPVLSGPHSFKMLGDFSHCAAAQFQGVGNLLVALAIFM